MGASECFGCDIGREFVSGFHQLSTKLRCRQGFIRVAVGSLEVTIKSLWKCAIDVEGGKCEVGRVVQDCIEGRPKHISSIVEESVERRSRHPGGCSDVGHRRAAKALGSKHGDRGAANLVDAPLARRAVRIFHEEDLDTSHSKCHSVFSVTFRS